MNKDYRQEFYARYVSSFKRELAADADYDFSDRKLDPLLGPWVKDLGRSAPSIDLGCGHGNMLHYLQGLGFADLYGVDASGEQIALARRILERAVCGRLDEYLAGFPDGYFGLITMFDVIEHMYKQEIVDLFGLASRKLMPGGVVIVHCPNGDSPFCGSIRYGDFTHETVLNPASARNVCELFGLADFEAKEHLGVSRSPAGMLRSLAWTIARKGIQCLNLAETGSLGSGVLTRNFAFRAVKAPGPARR